MKGIAMEIPAEALAQFDSPFDDSYGLRFTAVSSDRAVAEVSVGPHLHQPMGIVHGGIFAAAIEATCSVGASVWAGEHGHGVAAMGLSNHTDFLKRVSEGTLVIEALRIQSGGTLQLWEATVRVDGEPVAHGKVRLMNVKPRG